MSAPPGWHQQPDGRERFWDGQQWTEQFRTAAGSDPTAPPPPSWASGDATSSPVEADASAADQTQMMDVDRTQQLPTTPGAAGPASAGPGAAYGSTPYAAPDQPTYPTAYPPVAGPAAGYGSPGGWQPPPQKSGSSGLVKGCLITVVVLLVLLIGVVVAGILLFNRAADEVRDTLPTGFPTSLPSDFPSDLPTTLPSEGVGQRIQVTVGQGFEVPRAAVEDGWSLDAQGAGGLNAVQVQDMQAVLRDGGDLPVLFTMQFPTADGGTADTVCTSETGQAGDTVDIQCLPMLADVGDATQGTVTTTL